MSGVDARGEELDGVAAAVLGHPRVVERGADAAETLVGRLDALDEVRAGVNRLENLQVVLEILDEGNLLAGTRGWLLLDGAFVGLEASAVDAALGENAPVLGDVHVGLEEGEVSLADDDVVRGGVVVELLVPLLHPDTLHLLDVVAVHDVENLVANLLTLATLATLADGAEHQPGHVPQMGRVAEELGDDPGELGLRGGQLAGLDVVVALPRELAVGRVPEPDVNLSSRGDSLGD